MCNELPDIEDGAGNVRQIGSYPAQQLVGRHVRIPREIQLDVEFAEIGRLGVVIQVRASGALVDGDDLLIAQKYFAHLAA